MNKAFIEDKNSERDKDLIFGIYGFIAIIALIIIIQIIKGETAFLH